MFNLVYITAWEDSLRFLDTSYTYCTDFSLCITGILMHRNHLLILLILFLTTCSLQSAVPTVSPGDGEAVNGQNACQKDPYEPHPALTVDVRCPKVGEEFTIVVSNSTVEHPYYTVILDDEIPLVTLTYDGQVQPGGTTTAFEILSTQVSEWEMSITLSALEEGEFTFGVSATGLVGGMWTGNGYGSVLICVQR